MIKFPRMNMKNINRFILVALFCAPIVYLFGSLFTYLNGAHGSMELVGVGDYISDVETIDAVNMFRPSGTFSRYGIAVREEPNGSLDLSGSSSSVPSYNQFSFSYNTTFKRDGTKYLFDFPAYDGYKFGLSGYSASASSFIWSDNATNTWVGNFYLYIPSVGFDVDIEGFYCNIWNLTEMFGSGNEPTISEFHSKYPLTYYPYGLNHLEYNVYSAWPDSPTPQSNSYYLFGQFFSKDNFLSKMGQEALSDSEQGFYPANALLRVLDENVLHYGSDNQIACMAYGYFVWVFNVVLLDMVVYLSMKLLLLPLKAVDVFERGNDL